MISQENYLYTVLSLLGKLEPPPPAYLITVPYIVFVIAEIGGYLGLLLGFSIFQGSDFFSSCIDKQIAKEEAEEKKDESGEMSLKEVRQERSSKL